MKKLVFFLAMMVMPYAAKAQIYNYDVDGNGIVDVADAMYVINHILHIPNPGEEQEQKSYLTCPDDHHPHMIDLGLPSGTKWACCNVDTDHPENQSPTNYGGYYAWGETETKSTYSWSTYIHSCDDDIYSDLGRDIAGTEYDVAHVKWGESWMIPASIQIQELLNYCTSIWTSQNGVNGMVFTGPNGGTIFLPATGYYSDSGLSDAGSGGYYWSSTLYYFDLPIFEYFPSCLDLNLVSPGLDRFNLDRFYGCSVRPVIRNNKVTLFHSSQTLSVGEVSTTYIISGSGSYSAESSDASVVTAIIDGTSIKLTAVAVGTATVTVTDQRGQTATIDVKVMTFCPDDNHPHMVDLGLPSGTKWACCNVGADKPEADGSHYAWGETEEKGYYEYNWDCYIHCNGSEDTCHDLGSDIAGTEYDVAHVKWGHDWQMPSNWHIDELISNCTYEWTTVDGVEGGKFTSKTNGVSLFFPAACLMCISDENGVYGNFGSYWSSSQYPSDAGCAYSLYFGSGGVGTSDDDRSDGLSIRPVVCNYFPLRLSISSLNLIVGEGSTVSINSGSGNYSIENSNIGVVTATLSGTSIKVTAVAAGTATITITDTNSGQTTTIEATVEDKQPQSILTCPDDHHPHMIDLGLPSGTKWACCNVDTDHPENQSPTNYGGYYAWGETEMKSTYSWSTYIHCDGSSETCHDLGDDIAGTEYDVAHVKWGGSWMMPSKEQQDELRSNCTSTWTTQNDVSGILFTGTNGGSIFLPATGYYSESGLSDAGSGGYYWSSTQQPSLAYRAYYLSIGSDGTETYGTRRYRGLSVRPVVCDYKPLSLSLSSLELNTCEERILSLTSGSGFYSVGSSDASVAIASLSGTSVKITAVAVGTATITVTDRRDGQSVTIEVKVINVCPDDHHPHLIDLGLPSGTKWACCNVDTDHPENQSPINYGGYYAWGETEEKDVYNDVTYLYSTGVDEDEDGYYADYHSDTEVNGIWQNLGSDIAGTEYDVAHVKWGGSWVMPTEEQQDELKNNCTFKWTTVNGVKGVKFTGKKNGKSLFLPAAGYRYDSDLVSAGSYGNYWSSTQSSSLACDAYILFFDSGDTGWNYHYRHYGRSVRPVVRN